LPSVTVERRNSEAAFDRASAAGDNVSMKTPNPSQVQTPDGHLGSLAWEVMQKRARAAYVYRALTIWTVSRP